MSTAVPVAPKRRPFVTAACLALSCGALAVLAYVEHAPARADVLLRPDLSPAMDAAPVRARARRSAEPRLPAGATIAAARPASAHAGNAEPQAAAPAAREVVAPELEGKRLSIAQREARKLGLRVVARDEYGDRVPADAGRYYRVRRQLTEAGSQLEPGATIQLRVREIAALTTGY